MKNSRGFTLPELLVAIAFFVVFVGVAAFLLRPADTSIQESNAQRRLELAQLGQAIARYEKHYGKLPPGIPGKATDIGSEPGDYDLCPALVPAFLKDIPTDADQGAKLLADTGEATNLACTENGVAYLSGYTIALTPKGVVVLALAIPGNGQIIVTH